MDVRLTPAGLPSAPAGVSSPMLVGAWAPGSLRVLSKARMVCENLLYEDQVRYWRPWLGSLIWDRLLWRQMEGIRGPFDG
jgi:hypothetical protein